MSLEETFETAINLAHNLIPHDKWFRHADLYIHTSGHQLELISKENKTAVLEPTLISKYYLFKIDGISYDICFGPETAMIRSGKDTTFWHKCHKPRLEK